MTRGAHSVLTNGPSATDDQKQVSASQSPAYTRGKPAPHRESRDLAGLGEREGVSKGLAPGLDHGGDTGPCFVRKKGHKRGGELLAGPRPKALHLDWRPLFCKVISTSRAERLLYPD